MDQDESEQRARRAFDHAKANGTPWLATMLGVTAGSRKDGPELRLVERCGLFDLAMLADFSLGAALRTRLGHGRVLPTLTLTLELDPVELGSGVSVLGGCDPAEFGLGRAHGGVLAEGKAIGRGLASFAVPRSADGLAPMPWETDNQEPVPEQPLDEGERAVLAEVRAAAKHARGRPWSEQFLTKACTGSASGLWLRPNPAMRNRAGQVQGAVLFWLAAAASRNAATDGAHLVSGHTQFLAPAGADTPVRARPEVVYRTRRTVFTRAVLEQHGQAVAAGTFTFRCG